MYTNYVNKYSNIVVGIKTLAMYIHRLSLTLSEFRLDSRLRPSLTLSLSLSVFLTSPYNH